MAHHVPFGLAAAAAISALALSACSFSGNGPVITKSDLSGETTTEARALDGFTDVAVGGTAELTVTEGKVFSVEVTTDSGLQKYVTTRVEGSQLVIEQEYAMLGSSPRVQITVTLPELTALAVSGSATASVPELRAERFRLSASGASSVDVTAITSELTVDASGSADVNHRGSTDNASLSISGSADVDGANLTALTASLDASGSSDSSLRVIDTLDANVSGSATVTYFGKPTVYDDVSGAADVRAGA